MLAWNWSSWSNAHLDILGAFGFLFAGSSGMLRGQPRNPYYAKEIARGIREQGPSRMRASLFLLTLAGITFPNLSPIVI